VYALSEKSQQTCFRQENTVFTCVDENADGVTDKVVSKCLGCALAMDGSSEHALETSGYTLHFCSAPCKTGFEEDTTKAILALNIPGE
jgi:YHS domain-containing protein